VRPTRQQDGPLDGLLVRGGRLGGGDDELETKKSFSRPLFIIEV
jgi:hypothetical protein